MAFRILHQSGDQAPRDAHRHPLRHYGRCEPHYNPDAIEQLHDPVFVDTLLAKYAAYMDEMIVIRNRILNATGFDMFGVSKTLSKAWTEKADKRLKV